jgi:hypothetical protein
LAVALLAGETVDRVLTASVAAPRRMMVVWVGSLVALVSSWWLVDVTWVVVEANPGVAAPPGWLPSTTLATSVLAVFAAAALAAMYVAGQLWASKVVIGQQLAMAVLALATVLDLWLVAHLVQFTEVLDDPPISRLASSPVRQALSESKMPARVFAPMANFPTVLGVSATPVYFTFGPSEYTRRDLMMPSSQVDDPDDSFVPQTEAQMDWLERAGVTHIVSYKPIDSARWPVQEIWRGRDPVMNSALGRRSPLFLYRLTEGRGRVSWDSGADRNSITGYSGTGSEVVIDVTTRVAGRLVLTELMAEGWQVEVDGEPRKVELVEGMYRGVRLQPGESRVRWHYQPPGLYWGLLISGVALLMLATAGLIRYRKPGWLAGLELNEPS